ncbi:hypothetical protein MY4824_000527 [Beauveria thailandica]
MPKKIRINNKFFLLTFRAKIRSLKGS